MNKKVVIGLCGCIVSIVTVLLYCLFVEKLFDIPVRWLSLIFVLVSEGLIILKGFTVKKGIISYARLTAGILTFLLTVLTAFLFIKLFSESTKGYIFFNVLYLATEAIIDILLGYLMKKEKGL